MPLHGKKEWGCPTPYAFCPTGARQRPKQTRTLNAQHLNRKLSDAQACGCIHDAPVLRGTRPPGIFLSPNRIAARM
eukprot:2043736-Pyramimonas_sp.AAC.1